ncbi:MAG: hypothetical protein ACLQUY_04460 [Ktedonobacterales bacterium]
MPSVLASSFAGQVAAWHDFYALAGTAAATLLGLLFVAMSLHTDLTGRDLEVERELWTLAAGVLAIFADIVLSALVVLVPDQTAVGTGLPLVVLGALTLLVNVVVTRRVHRLATASRQMWAPQLLSCMFQALAGVGIIVGESVWLVVLAVVTGLLLLSALLASWLLLSGPALITLGGRGPWESPPNS